MTNGRPVGSGYRTIRVGERTDNPGYHVFIGRALYQEIGSPERLDIVEVSRYVYRLVQVRYDDEGWAVVGGQGMPRLSVGKTQIEFLQLDEGVYPAEIVDEIIQFSTL